MKVSLPYGRRRIEVDIPDENLAGVLVPHYPPPVENPASALGESLNGPLDCPPLGRLGQGRRSACLVIPDGTRPFPHAVILPPILATLSRAGVPRDGVTILVATGLHRAYERHELKYMGGYFLMGADVFGHCQVVNHLGRDLDSHVYLGTTQFGVPIHVDRRYLEADFRIVAGLVEPHFNAGYSGGRKLVCPGLCSVETIQALHATPFQAHPNAISGRLEGNPFHENALAAARMAPADFAVNVAINDRRQVTGIWSGDPESSHRAACEAVGAAVVAPLGELADIAVTSNAGHPLDCNLYQANKGMLAARPVVRPGGTVICAAACNEGLGSQEFAEVMLSHDSLVSLWADLRDPTYRAIDQWGAVKMAEAASYGEVMLLSELDDDLARRAFVTPVKSLEEGLERALAKHGPKARIVAIPDGPYVIAKYDSDATGT